MTLMAALSPVIQHRRERHAAAFPGDPTGLEAFVNHIHLPDLVSGPSSSDRQTLARLGKALVRVWGERLRPLLRGRTALFILSGRLARDMTLRFHIERKDGRPWLDQLDDQFIRRERVNLYRVTESEVREVSCRFRNWVKQRGRQLSESGRRPAAYEYVAHAEEPARPGQGGGEQGQGGRHSR